MTRLTMIFAATALLVFTTTGCADTAKWRVTPSMRLPAPPEVKAKVVKVLAYHDFADDTDTWRPRSEHIAIERVADGHDSSGALRVTGTQPDGWNFAWSPMISVEANRTYRASLWIKRNSTPEGSGPLFFKAEIFNRERKKKAARAMSARIPLNDVGNWHRLSVEFTPVEGAQHVGIALEKGTGEPAAIDATIDDFRLEQLEASTVDLRMRSAQLVGPIAKELVGVHPRLYMDAAKLEQLRTEVRTNPKWAPAMKALLEIANRGVLRGVPDYDKEVATPRKTESKAVAQLWERPIGNMMPHLAMAWLLTGDRKYLDSAKQWVLTALDYPTWGMGTQNNMNLAAGHLFAGVGLAYDWLYHDLTQEERAAIRRKLVPRGMEMLRGAETGRAPWRNAYMQNHLWVSVGGLATSAFAICDEAPEANAWVHLAHDNFVKTLETVGDDGASHEGYGYWEYGAEYIMRYTELADSMLGIDLYHADGAPHPWLKNNAYYALHMATPMAFWTRRQCTTDLADSPRNHWYGPSYLLRNQARRFADSREAGLAQWLAHQMEAKGVDATGQGHCLNLVWFDPSLPEIPQTEFPTMHHFEDLGIVSARSAWEGAATQLVVKCGPPLGHKHADAKRNYGAGHVHPDCGHFTLVVGGDVVLRDDGYAHPKTTAWHNALLVDGKGQKGEAKWFDYGQWIREPGAPRILTATSTPQLDTIVCDPTEAYPKALGLRNWTRRFEFHKPDRIVIFDEVATERPAELEWRFFCEGSLEKRDERRFVTTSGRASAEITVESPDPVAANKTAIGTGRYEATPHDCLTVKTQGKTSAAHLTTTIRIQRRAE